MIRVILILICVDILLMALLKSWQDIIHAYLFKNPTLPRNLYAEVPLLFTNKILDSPAISSLQL